MSKTVSTREAQNKLSALIGWVNEHDDEVIVENRGAPSAVIISYAEYEKLQGLREQERRRALLAKMRQLQARVSERNADLGEVEADALADEVAGEAVAELVESGSVRFEQ